MKNDFRHILPEKVHDNVFKMIGDDWMLITAGEEGNFNTMTASWGSMGVLWNLPVGICFIRPQRYTFGFAERSAYYTLSFFGEEHREILKFCGAKSGRDFDKIKETGLRPFTTDLGNIGYDQARLILECRKLYAGDLKEDDFVIRELVNKNYRKRDFHRFYIGEVVDVLVR